jgi:hypothetical protein
LRFNGGEAYASITPLNSGSSSNSSAPVVPPWTVELWVYRPSLADDTSVKVCCTLPLMLLCSE